MLWIVEKIDVSSAKSFTFDVIPPEISSRKDGDLELSPEEHQF